MQSTLQPNLSFVPQKPKRHKRATLGMAVLALLFFVHCGGGAGTAGGESSPETSEVSASDSAVGNAMASGMNTLNQSLQLSSNGLSAGTAAVFLKQENVFSLVPQAWANLGNVGCSNTDPDVTVTLACSDVDHTATIVRDFGEGCEVGERLVITGKEYLGWTDMGSPACTGVRKPDFWTAVQGAGAQRIHSTDPDHSTNPQSAVVRTFANGSFVKVIGHGVSDYSQYQNNGNTQSVTASFTLPNTSRIKYKNDGVTKIFDHTLTTPTPLNITLGQEAEKSLVKTLHSGQVNVSHNLAQFTLQNVFAELKYDYNQCECFPVSGTVNITVTDNNTQAQLGSGTLTFKGAETGVCGDQEVTYQGRTIRLPNFERCR